MRCSPTGPNSSWRVVITVRCFGRFESNRYGISTMPGRHGVRKSQYFLYHALLAFVLSARLRLLDRHHPRRPRLLIGHTASPMPRPQLDFNSTISVYQWREGVLDVRASRLRCICVCCGSWRKARNRSATTCVPCWQRQRAPRSLESHIDCSCP